MSKGGDSERVIKPATDEGLSKEERELIKKQIALADFQLKELKKQSAFQDTLFKSLPSQLLDQETFNKEEREFRRKERAVQEKRDKLALENLLAAQRLC